MLQYNEHVKDYFLTRMTGGLHPMYTALCTIWGCSQEEKEEVDALLMGTMQDLFDTVSYIISLFRKLSSNNFNEGSHSW